MENDKYFWLATAGDVATASAQSLAPGQVPQLIATSANSLLSEFGMTQMAERILGANTEQPAMEWDILSLLLMGECGQTSADT